MIEPATQKETLLFTFLRFNARRQQRGAEAAEVEVTWPNGDIDILWMSQQDLHANANEHGWQDGLRCALAAYRNSKP